MNKLIGISIFLLAFLLNSGILTAQESMRELEKQRLFEEKARKKADKKKGKTQNIKRKEPSEDLALTDKKPKARKRGQSVTKASSRLSGENNRKNQNKNKYRKKSKGLTKAAKNQRKTQNKR